MAETKTVYTFDVPPEMGEEVTQVEIKMLRLHEEQDAHKRSGGDNMKAAHELSKTALVGVFRGEEYKKLGLGDGSVDTFWKEASSPLRQLIAAAYLDVNQPKEESTKAFLATKKIKVS